ncbi:baseplate tail tube cap [Vibrio phage D480]|nr:baseplate tail tube cap [Vibrio phage 6E35.1a]
MSWIGLTGKQTNTAERILSMESGPSGGVTETKEITDDEKDAKAQGSSNVALTYPANLGAMGGHPNFFMFRAYDMASTTKQHYTDMRSSFTSNQSERESADKIPQELMATIALYAPNVVEEVSHEFDKTATSVFSDFLADAAAAVGADSTQGKVEGAGKAIRTGVGATLAQAKRSFIQQNAAAQLEKNSSVVTDNVTVSSYKGTSQRQQTLVYIFHPKSLDELKTVGQIIKTFYSLSLPIKTSISGDDVVGYDSTGADGAAGFAKYATLLKTPPVWLIEEVSDSSADRWTPRFIFGPAGITSVKLNRTPDQYWRTFRGTAGDPSGIEMEITFTELIPLDRAMYLRDVNSSINGYQDNTVTASGDSEDSGSFIDDVKGIF